MGSFGASSLVRPKMGYKVDAFAEMRTSDGRLSLKELSMSDTEVKPLLSPKGLILQESL